MFIKKLITSYATHLQNPHYKHDHRLWTREILYFCQNTHFKKLVILDFIDGTKEAYVTFRAHLMQMGFKQELIEKSHFVKEGPQCLYKNGTTEKLD